jgi:uncharacterized protein
MEISLYSITTETFEPMLRSLSEVLDKGALSARARNIEPAVLINARLAPDMYPLVKQVLLACNHARDAVALLIGEQPPSFADNEQTFDELKARIASTIKYIESTRAAAFEGAENREVKFPLPNNAGSIVMNGFQFLRDWATPHFYFHLVTAYDILRQAGVEIGKRDYLGRVAAYIRPPA